ncbi:DUF421 domain-containing protein [Zhaonella formicivorans]|uniref:DUF421 domain-containing protein n=1 Tax=Zhaonella formicivorans TaxID=2528593 RepID=UPI0010EAA145|nr:DUF421 domain-containing protein [Zhaonella formicivorans]
MSIVLVVVIRSFISFFALLLLVRLMGKQQVAELTFFDYVVGITIGSIAATLSVQVNQNTLATLIGMAIWTVLPVLLAYFSLHSVWVRKVVEGEATVVIQNGKILEKNLRKLRLSIDDMISMLRAQGVFNIADVEFALFEANGKLSVQKRSQKRPVTPEDLQLSTQYEGMPTNLIEDGTILTDALKNLSLSKAWLIYQLQQHNIRDVKDVSLAQLDTNGNLYVDLQGEQNCITINIQGK